MANTHKGEIMKKSLTCKSEKEDNEFHISLYPKKGTTNAKNYPTRTCNVCYEKEKAKYGGLSDSAIKEKKRAAKDTVGFAGKWISRSWAWFAAKIQKRQAAGLTRHWTILTLHIETRETGQPGIEKSARNARAKNA